MAAAGLLKISLPKSIGGNGGGLLDTVLVTEELARVSATLVNIYLVNAVFSGALILLAGTDASAVFRLWSPLLRCLFQTVLSRTGTVDSPGTSGLLDRVDNHGYRLSNYHSADYLLCYPDPKE